MNRAQPNDRIRPASPRMVVLAMVLAGAASSASAQLPFERTPIEYSKKQASDAVALLAKKVERAEVDLARDDKYGYLVSLLNALDVPIWSQTLVFSKTSLQRHLISPSNPRAVYFNDDVYIAWIPDGELIEIAATDPMLGSVFYTVNQVDEDSAGSIVRRIERCLFCHGSSDTGRVPGLIMKSVYTNSKGNRVFPPASIHPDPDGPLRGRWSGWFVTGTHGKQPHLGNLMVDSRGPVKSEALIANLNKVELSDWFDVTEYLSPHSDIVALFVLQHQVTTHNLLTDVNHRARVLLHHAAELNREQGRDVDFLSDEDSILLDQIAERLVDGLLMVGDTSLHERVAGTSEFAERFAAKGPRDSIGRSLRQFNLENRLFQYRCSYLIYSESFDSLPKPILSFTYRRLLEVLSSKDVREKYTHLSAAERDAILQILLETKSNLPATWRKETEPLDPKTPSLE